MAFIETVELLFRCQRRNVKTLHQLQDMVVRGNKIGFPSSPCFIKYVDVTAAKQTLGVMCRRGCEFNWQARCQGCSSPSRCHCIPHQQNRQATLVAKFAFHWRRHRYISPCSVVDRRTSAQTCSGTKANRSDRPESPFREGLIARAMSGCRSNPEWLTNPRVANSTRSACSTRPCSTARSINRSANNAWLSSADAVNTAAPCSARLTIPMRSIRSQSHMSAPAYCGTTPFPSRRVSV